MLAFASKLPEYLERSKSPDLFCEFSSFWIKRRLAGLDPAREFFIEASCFTHRFGEARAGPSGGRQSGKAALRSPAEKRRSRIGARRNIGSSGQHPCSRAPGGKGKGYVASTIFKTSLDARRAAHILIFVEALKA
jgi:hypothetical protein